MQHLTTIRRVKKQLYMTYDWDKKLQGHILGAYFWGFTISGLPGGAIAERFGPHLTVTVSFVACGILTILGPWATSLHPIVLIISRFLIGLAGGVVYPSLHCLLARWVPPDEKGKFLSAMMGGSLGTVCTWSTLGWAIEAWGWSAALASCGGMALGWTALWWWAVRDSPERHPWIGEDELKYITERVQTRETAGAKKRLPPYKEIFLSVPFWALVVLHFGNMWALFFLLTAGPNFITNVLAFDLGHTGILAALPYLARLILACLFGQIAHIIPGLLLATQTLTGCDVNWAIVLITLSLGLNGASTLTNLQNAHDLAPNFAGTLYGIANCIGSTTGFISPLIVGYLTSKHNGLHEWHTIFYIGASVYIGSGIIFWIFGSGDVQAWNDAEDTENKREVAGIENVGFDDVEIHNNDRKTT
nr:unnamed protein product [Callosobruchus analis]